ncbi:MAG: diguanylate cyclase [Betaproteobacteria bacterium]|nr:diguanylate cyclase [Betaproteobacteria bacterium]
MHAPASLRRHFLWLLLGVVAVFASGIALSIWFSLRAGGQEQQRFLRLEAVQTRAGVVRLLEHYRLVLDKAAHDPELVRLMRAGTAEERRAWAVSRQRLLPDVLDIALLDSRGRVLADALPPDARPRSRQIARRPTASTAVRPVLRREKNEPGHFDLAAQVRAPGGGDLGGVRLSVQLAAFQRVIDDSIRPGHTLVIRDAAGDIVVGRAEIAGRSGAVRQAIPDSDWTLVARSPLQFFSLGGQQQVLAGLATLGLVLLLLAASLFRVRRAMLNDIVSTRDALTALAHDDPVPSIMPHYVEFEAAAQDINQIALHLQEQRSRLERLSLTDPLTGLPNRRAFETRFPQAQGLAERQHPVALILLDIDHFKEVNDRHGHGVGDQVLLALAQSLKDLTRRADLAARLAGDEFVVLLSDLDADGVGAWYQRLADRFRSELSLFGLDLHTGLSAGQTWLGGRAGDSIDNALMRADHALYEAKAQGRGRLIQHVEQHGDSAG